MKKILLSAMMIMAMMCATTNASAQDHKCDKNKKECCEKKQACEKKDAKACCEKKDAKACEKKEAKSCCEKKDAKSCCEKKDAKTCEKKEAKACEKIPRGGKPVSTLPHLKKPSLRWLFYFSYFRLNKIRGTSCQAPCYYRLIVL